MKPKSKSEVREGQSQDLASVTHESPLPAPQRDGYPPLDDEPRGFTKAEWTQIVNANYRRFGNQV